MTMVYAKIGTMPAEKFKALHKRTTPKVGDILNLRSYDPMAWEDYRVRVTEIRDVGQKLFVCERW